MKQPMSLECANCRQPFDVTPANNKEREMYEFMHASCHCPACRATAEHYYRSDTYKAFEESEA